MCGSQLGLEARKHEHLDAPWPRQTNTWVQRSEVSPTGRVPDALQCGAPPPLGSKMYWSYSVDEVSEIHKSEETACHIAG